MRETKSSSQIFKQEKNELFIDSLTRWDTQLKGLVELERRCQELNQEVESLSERQEVLSDLVQDKSTIHSKANEKYNETIFEEMRELEEKKSKEVLTLIRKSTFCYDVKAKGKERECCKDLQGRDRLDMGLTLETSFPLSRTRLP